LDLSRAVASVIVLNYNGRHFLEGCLASLEAQRFHDFEAWLVDNGSQDGSVEFVADRFPWVRVMTLGQNLGFCAGNNAAIKQAKGDFIVLLNNDTVVEPEWLGALVGAAQEDPRVGICASRILSLHRPDLIYAAGDCYSIAGHAFRRGEGLSAAGRFEKAEEVFTACACAALYRRSMLDEIGLLDEDFFSNCEDVDLGFRSRLGGYSCLYVPEAVVYHFGSGTAGVKNARVEFLDSRNIEYVFFKNMPGLLLLQYLPLHVMLLSRTFAQRLPEGLAVAFLRGKADFLANLLRVVRKRRIIQRRRKVQVQALARAMDRRFISRVLKKLVRWHLIPRSLTDVT